MQRKSPETNSFNKKGGLNKGNTKRFRQDLQYVTNDEKDVKGITAMASSFVEKGDEEGSYDGNNNNKPTSLQ